MYDRIGFMQYMIIIHTLNIYSTMAWHVYVARYLSGWFIADVSTCHVQYS